MLIKRLYIVDTRVNKHLVNGEKCALQFKVVLRFRSKLYQGAHCLLSFFPGNKTNINKLFYVNETSMVCA